MLRPNHTRPGTVPFVRASCRVKAFLPAPPYKPSTLMADHPRVRRAVLSCRGSGCNMQKHTKRKGREVRTDRRACQRFRSLRLKHFSRHRTGRTAAPSNASTDPNQTDRGRGSKPRTMGTKHLRQDPRLGVEDSTASICPDPETRAQTTETSDRFAPRVCV